jgi:uncharacterized protein (DUF885 family)
MPDTRFRSDLFELADEFIERNAELEPITATRQGIDRYDDRLNDFSAAHTNELVDLVSSTLKALDSTEAIDDVDRLGKAFMVERLTTQLDMLESGEERRTFSVLWSPASEIRRVFEIQPAENEEHAARIRSRLEGVRRSLRSWQSTLDEDSSRDMTPPRRHALGVARQLATFAEGSYASVAERLARACGVDTESSGLAAAAADADLACGELSQWMRAEYAPRCPEADAAGPERYRRWSAYWNGAQLDLDEIYEWGWEDLKRINSRMWEIAAEVAPGARTLAEAAHTLDADESRALHGTEALLEALKALTAGAVEMLQGKHFDIDERARFCDARLAPEGSAAAAYYVPASEDLSRPGTTWYPTLGRDRFPIWRDVSTWYHESVPGHHLQFSTSLLERQRQTRYQRLEGFVSGYGEGWALYAERLMEELGALSDPADEMGYLSGQALRAARIVVDIGMHLGRPAPADIGALGGLGDVAGRVWDAEMAVAMLEDRAILENDKATSEVDRYLGVPGQAIAYKVGERIWLRCRQEARERLGDAFDLKAWHAYGLGLGSLGLDLFQEEMARFGAP